jgi:hypothetical protein
MTRDDLKQAIFGGADGLTSALGAIVVLAAKGDYQALVIASVAYAVGAAWSMGGSEYLSDFSGSLRRATVMALATLTYSIAPAIPFFALSGLAAWIGAIVITVLCAALIAEARPYGALKSYTQTFGIVGVGAVLAVGASLLAGVLI